MGKFRFSAEWTCAQEAPVGLVALVGALELRVDLANGDKAQILSFFDAVGLVAVMLQYVLSGRTRFRLWRMLWMHCYPRRA